MFSCDGQGFHNFNRQESRTTMKRSSLSSCRECSMSRGGMPDEYGEGAECLCCSGAQGTYALRAGFQARTNEVTSLNTGLALWEIGGHAHKRQAGDLKVSAASGKLFLRNWRFPGTLPCLNSCHSSNVIHTIQWNLFPQTHSHTCSLRVWEVFGRQECGKMQLGVWD